MKKDKKRHKQKKSNPLKAKSYIIADTSLHSPHIKPETDVYIHIYTQKHKNTHRNEIFSILVVVVINIVLIQFVVLF